LITKPFSAIAQNWGLSIGILLLLIHRAMVKQKWPTNP